FRLQVRIADRIGPGEPAAGRRLAAERTAEVVAGRGTVTAGALHDRGASGADVCAERTPGPGRDVVGRAFGAQVTQAAEAEDLRGGLEQLGDVRRTFRPVETAADPQPVADLPVTEDLVGPAAAGGVVVRVAGADFEVELLD